ncbi:enoyl-CoA hydratase [Nocardia aurantia]|uniref:1,2-epoxyphenylacetyl-CoA isomerase n=1 Tax=Nocardia aurantia TaxID=2585199 RepID=A0A7K0E228_9NOCA|nr:enoyl-CoA hydratase [Nocardia aurantia]MQY31858.1 1,2-epoxyphenylacetyl-CoA isomerase [Nocardia aurantia]
MSPVTVHTADCALRITFDRPTSLNALTGEMLGEVSELVEKSAHDDDIRVIVLTGAGRAFSSGADIGEVNADREVGPETLDNANRLIRAIRRVPKPVVAAVNGPAAGVACSIALAADLTVAAESAYFLLAFAGIGLMPDGGATALVPAAVGRARAVRMAMLGERIDARTAEEWGMISLAVPADQFVTTVNDLTAKLATGPTAAYAETKRAFNATALAQLETALDVERAGQTALFATADFAEGTAAFAAKRRPRFQGK